MNGAVKDIAEYFSKMTYCVAMTRATTIIVVQVKINRWMCILVLHRIAASQSVTPWHNSTIEEEVQTLNYEFISATLAQPPLPN